MIDQPSPTVELTTIVFLPTTVKIPRTVKPPPTVYLPTTVKILRTVKLPARVKLGVIPNSENSNRSPFDGSPLGGSEFGSALNAILNIASLQGLLAKYTLKNIVLGIEMLPEEDTVKGDNIP